MAYIKTEEVSAIRNELKKRFGHTGLKFGVKKQHHSSVHVTIKAGPIDFSDIYRDHYGSGDHYAQVNVYHLSNYGQHQPFFEEVLKIIKTAPALAEGGREWQIGGRHRLEEARDGVQKHLLRWQRRVQDGSDWRGRGRRLGWLPDASQGRSGRRCGRLRPRQGAELRRT